MKQVRERSNISAYVILNSNRVHVATVQVWHGNTVQVDVWHGDGTELQQGKAGGYGYDKFTAALRGMKIDGHIMYDHCGQSEDSKKMIKAYISASAKPGFEPKKWEARAKKKGYQFANWAHYDRMTGERLEYRYQQGLGWFCYRNFNDAIADVNRVPDDEIIGRYSSLYIVDGLHRLEMLGYTVIQGI